MGDPSARSVGSSPDDRTAGGVRAARTLALVFALVVTAYFGTWNGGFYFDDLPSVRDNVAIQAGDGWGAAFGERHSPIANRPLTCLSLVVDRALWGPTVAGHRVVNLLLHLGNVALLFLVLRLALRGGNLAARFDAARGRTVALATTAVWAVHPLAVDAVGYITQRSTLLMAMWALTTFYAVLRADRSPQRARHWRALAILSLALGMASKEDMVVMPLLIPLFERAFLLPSWRSLRPRLPFHGAAAATWFVLAACVLGGPSNPTVGFATTPRATACEWLMTQAGVVAHYLRLVVWPTSLRGCYDWPIVRELGPAIAPGVLVVLLLAATAIGWRRWPAWGFLGAWFFLVLAPTSSVLPIVTEPAAERRMYLPMLAVLVPLALGFDALLRRSSAPKLAVAVLVAALSAMIVATRARVAVYRDEASFWTDAYARRDPGSQSFMSSLLLASYAKVVRLRGDLDHASELLAAASACEHATPTVRLHYATSLIELGRYAAAAPVLQAIAVTAPQLAYDLGGRAARLVGEYRQDAPAQRRGANDPRLIEAHVLARAAVGLAPQRSAFAHTLGLVLESMGRTTEAEASIRRGIDLEAAVRRPK